MNDRADLLARLDAICFHDVPVTRISLETNEDPFSTDFVVDFALHTEETDDYDCFTLRFIGITELKTDELFLYNKSDFEITNFDYEWTELFEGELLFLLGFGQASFTVKLACERIELTPKLIE